MVVLVAVLMVFYLQYKYLKKEKGGKGFFFGLIVEICLIARYSMLLS